MAPRIFNEKNPFNVKGKNHGSKPINISTIKSKITMTLSIQENISRPHSTRMVYNFSQLSPSVVKTRTLFLIITLALLLFGWDEMRYSNSSQAFLFIGEGCGFLQEWVVDVNKWVTFTKLFVTLIFTFLSGVCKSQGQRNQFQALGKCSTTSYACLGMCSSMSYVFEFTCLL